MIGGGLGAFLISSRYQSTVYPPPRKLNINSLLLTRTPQDNAYTLVEFLDYQCPPCRATYKRLPKILTAQEKQVNILIRNFPLESHKGSMFAAMAAEASREQGKFDTFHSLLITLDDFSEESIYSLVGRSGMDKERFQRDLHKSAERRVLEDLQCAKSLGVNSTPSFFLCTPEGSVYRLYSPNQIKGLVR